MTVMDRVPVEQITADAREVHFGRALVTAVAAIFFAIGWITGRSLFAAKFCALAVRYGYREGIGRTAVQPPPDPDRVR